MMVVSKRAALGNIGRLPMVNLETSAVVVALEPPVGEPCGYATIHCAEDTS